MVAINPIPELDDVFGFCAEMMFRYVRPEKHAEGCARKDTREYDQRSFNRSQSGLPF
jgi:hypothetical protein